MPKHQLMFLRTRTPHLSGSFCPFFQCIQMCCLQGHHTSICVYIRSVTAVNAWSDFRQVSTGFMILQKRLTHSKQVFFKYLFFPTFKSLFSFNTSALGVTLCPTIDQRTFCL